MNINTIARSNLMELLENRPTPCFSLFQPTERGLAGRQQNPVRFRRLLTGAADSLLQHGSNKFEAEEFLEEGLLLVKESPFWGRQLDGLAVYISPGEFLVYQVPFSLPEKVVAGTRYHIRPLLRSLNNDTRFYVLTLSLAKARLYEVDQTDINELTPADMPEGPANRTAPGKNEKYLQFHTRTSGGEGARPALFHGHGEGKDEKEQRVIHYLHQVSQAVVKSLSGEGHPLVVVGSDKLPALYRRANEYHHLLDSAIELSPEKLSARELRDRVAEVVRDYCRAEEDRVLDRFKQLSKENLTVGILEELLPMAHSGRVETLFVANGAERFGRFDPGSGRVEVIPGGQANPDHSGPAEGNEDLIDRAAVEVLRSKGSVYDLPGERMPADTPIAATLRF